MKNFELEARLYLENLQEQVYGFFNLGSNDTGEINNIEFDKIIKRWLKSRNALQDDEVAIENFTKKYRDILIEAQLNKPTKLEHGGWYSILKNAEQEFKEIFKILNYTPPKFYLFGTLPTNRVNGMAMRIPNNPYKLIILETGLFPFAHSMCKVLATSFVLKETIDGGVSFSTNVDECKNKIDLNPIIIQRFYNILMAYIISGDVRYIKRYYTDEFQESMKDIMTYEFEYFVFAHEFGHLIAGHLDNSEEKQINIANTEINSIIINWQQEFEADNIAASILINLMLSKGFDVSLSYFGIEVFWGCIDIVEKTLSILKTGIVDTNTVSETHPPTLMRRERLRKLVAKAFEFDIETSNSIVSASKNLESIIKYLWDKIEPAIFELRKSNIQPSNHWL